MLKQFYKIVLPNILKIKKDFITKLPIEFFKVINKITH